MARDAEGRRLRRTWPQRLLISFNVLVIFATLAAAAALGWANDKLGEIERFSFDGGVLDEESTDAGEPQNYLLVGTDSAARLDPNDPAARIDQGVLSDTIMVLRVDPAQTQAQLLSFPRDLWVTIPNWGESKINAALSAGRESLIATIQENFGIPINHYVEVDFLGFKGLVEAVDGIPIYFDHALRDTNTGLFVGHTGCITLSPDQALAYVRSRHLDYYEDGAWQDDGSSDLGRISRQQDFIRRAIQRSIDKGVRNLVTLNALVNAGVGSVSLDDTITVDDLIDLGKRFRNFTPEELNTMALDVAYDFAGEISILRMIDNEANQARLNIFRGVAGPGTDAAVADAASVSIQALNGTGTSGQATEVSSGLAALGFDVSPGSGDAESFDIAQTTVRYKPGSEVDAAFVAAQFPGGAVLQEVPDTGYADVVVVSGADFAGVGTSLVAPPTATTVPPTDTAPTTTTTLPDLPTTTVQGIVPQTPEGQSCD
jgi:polyisoprenyl-teichoic acid--peptidoglycan teichoic acid transferase